jgi:hypothetical protein
MQLLGNFQMFYAASDDWSSENSKKKDSSEL